MVDGLALKGRIIEKGKSVDSFAKEIGIAGSTLRLKIAGANEFTVKETVMIKNKLGFTMQDFLNIFYKDEF